ncbi:MAG: hypothetical protein K6F86_01360 [Lachnospiraceae bacterium]|nr:hypothetical protein [Lachnospiraceae bacterium]
MAKDVFEQVLKNKRVPVLTLDNKWHKLFNNGDFPGMKAHVDALNSLLKEQARVQEEIKKLKKIKQSLMDDIVENMPDGELAMDAAQSKKVAESRRLIDEANEKLQDCEDKLLDLPKMIDEENYQLMLLSMDICYDELLENTEDIENIGAWIKEMRMELKKNILKKQQKEVKNVELYTYMHDIFGPDVISIFDIKYDVEKKKQEMIAAAQARAEERKKKEMKETAIRNIAEGKVPDTSGDNNN